MSEIVIQGTTPGIRVSGTGAQVTVKVTTGSGGGGGVTDHNLLTGRSGPDQHPIGAVTGLQVALDGKASTDAVAAIGGRNAPNGYAGLDASALLPENLIPASIARDSEVASGLAGKADTVHTHTLSQVADAGTAAAAAATDFATATQGGKADSAVQSVVAGTGVTVNSTDPRNPVVSAASSVDASQVAFISQVFGG